MLPANTQNYTQLLQNYAQSAKNQTIKTDAALPKKLQTAVKPEKPFGQHVLNIVKYPVASSLGAVIGYSILQKPMKKMF